MKFPHLIWALGNFGPRYKFAASIGYSETWLSRRLAGRLDFSAEERDRLAAVLGYPASWLFEEPTPPTQRKEPSPIEV
jgi:hypothetical protein